MASAADVRSILALPSTPSAAGPSQPRKQSTTSTRKPEGISRELYSLIGPSAPSLAAHLAKPRLKQKPNLGGGGKVKWEWRPFRNSGRTDSLQLHHWVQATTEPDAEYPFAKYNIQPTTYTYSQDEYTRLLEDENKIWTKEETDYLFKLVQEYDSRWFVIHDRYDYPDGEEHSLEDLKDRYYGVCRKLLRSRPWAGDEASRNQLYAKFEFDKGREETRKKYIASLENRTPEQIAEEDALFIEIKRLEQNERRFKKERDELLRTLAGVDSGLPDVIGEEDGFGDALVADPKKKRRPGVDTNSPSTPSNIISLGPPPPRKAQTAKSAAYDATHCIIRTDTPATTSSATKAAHQAAHLRSFKLPQPKTAMAPKIAQVLSELGVTHTRLVMPTRENSAQLESLLEATSALVETKKVVDKVEQDIRVLKLRLGNRESEGADTTGPGTGGTGTSAATPMDMDETEVKSEEGREQSVLSTRSVRSRKQTRRSISVSSVDTTVSARVNKRQKRG
ncbi:hypothetical protein PLICRDRAFT_86353 [Plicaturopsis crispa FD-325 SS-3]|nr:hypothetical protein PLICRDRAFT_86353 [Plicaturopsis crispa FD-325 SS-3]